jgi:hypothetical protein
VPVNVQTAGVDDYPVVVNITDVDSGTVIWSGSQRRLFRKYASDRAAAIVEIESAVRGFLTKVGK